MPRKTSVPGVGRKLGGRCGLALLVACCVVPAAWAGHKKDSGAQDSAKSAFSPDAQQSPQPEPQVQSPPPQPKSDPRKTFQPREGQPSSRGVQQSDAHKSSQAAASSRPGYPGAESRHPDGRAAAESNGRYGGRPYSTNPPADTGEEPDESEDHPDTASE